MPGVRTVLVTGVSSHVAGAMADRLAASALRMRAMVRTPDQARMVARRGWRPVTGDLAAPGSLGAVVHGADLVVHHRRRCAALARARCAFLRSLKMTGEAAAVTATRRTDVVALIAGLVTVTLWGSAFVGIRAAGEAFSPGALGLGRLLVSSAILGAVALVRREPVPRGRDVLAIAAYGVLWLGVYSVTLNGAERHVDAGTAAMIINIGPILIAILAGIVLREGFPRRLFAGCAVAFGGCVLISLAAIGSGSRSGLGVALCIVAASAYAVAVVVQKPVLARVSPFQVTWIGCAAATVACLPFAPALVADAAKAGAGTIGWTIYLGAGPTALGFATWAIALRRTSAGRMASLTYLIPLVAIVLGWAVLGETPPWLAVGGGVLCLAGVVLARRRSAPAPADGHDQARLAGAGR